MNLCHNFSHETNAMLQTRRIHSEQPENIFQVTNWLQIYLAQPSARQILALVQISPHPRIEQAEFNTLLWSGTTSAHEIPRYATKTKLQGTGMVLQQHNLPASVTLDLVSICNTNNKNQDHV